MIRDIENLIGGISKIGDTHYMFFHASGVINPKFEELKEGNRVEYLEEDTKKVRKQLEL